MQGYLAGILHTCAAYSRTDVTLQRYTFSMSFGITSWPNGVASSRKLRTWVYLRLRLARTCVHLRWLAMICAHFGWDQICRRVDASFSPFGHTIQVNASQVTSINLLLANKIEDSLLWNVFICDLRVLVRKFACPFGHPTQVSTQVQLTSTCDYLLVRLTRALHLRVSVT